MNHIFVTKWSAPTLVAHSATTSSILSLKRQCLLCRESIYFGTPLRKHCRLNSLIADEIPYWEYKFLAEDDCGRDGFKVEYDDYFWADKDGNDFLLMLIVSLPQCAWLKLYGDPESVYFSPRAPDNPPCSAGGARKGGYANRPAGGHAGGDSALVPPGKDFFILN
jgi:hypothetical protein